MKTCKDCIHYSVCCDEYELAHAEYCNDFKDKSRYVELPCKVGDTVYEIAFNHKMIIESEIREYKIKNFEDLLMLLLDLERGWIVNFYSDKAKAEAKLKELKNNLCSQRLGS